MQNLIENAVVYGLENSVRVSKYPMQIDISKCTDEITNKTRSLAGAPRGSGHDNFLKGILVQFDLTFTVKAWTEAERYHWFDIVSSQSTMHRISKMNIDDCCCSYVTEKTKKYVKELQQNYLDDQTPKNYLRLLYNAPTGIMLTAGISTNYLQLKTIYGQRRNHVLPEWRWFCSWIESLPYSWMITGKCYEGDEDYRTWPRGRSGRYVWGIDICEKGK